MRQEARQRNQACKVHFDPRSKKQAGVLPRKKLLPPMSTSPAEVREVKQSTLVNKKGGKYPACKFHFNPRSRRQAGGMPSGKVQAEVSTAYTIQLKGAE